MVINISFPLSFEMVGNNDINDSLNNTLFVKNIKCTFICVKYLLFIRIVNTYIKPEIISDIKANDCILCAFQTLHTLADEDKS